MKFSRSSLAGFPLGRRAGYGWAVQGVLRGMGGIYFLSFWSLAVQAEALFGSEGLSPMTKTMGRIQEAFGIIPYLSEPTWFWIPGGENLLLPVLAAGTLAGLLMALGLAPWWMNVVAWSCWLSLMQVAGTWMDFQGDRLLAEVGFVCLFLASPWWKTLPPPERTCSRPLGVLMCNLLLVSVMFGSGWGKMTSGDPFWLRETALHVYFQSQPLPAAPAWLFHQLPEVVLKYALWGVMFIELVLPLYVFLPRTFRKIAAGGFTLYMALVWISGNHGMLPALVMLLSLTLVEDRSWREALPEGRGPALPAPDFQHRSFGAASLTWLALWAPISLGSIWLTGPEDFPPLWRQTAGVLRVVRVGEPYRFYPQVRPRRVEVEIQGSLDGETWREYLFKQKPGHPQRLQRVGGIHFPRLDRRFHNVAGRAGDPLAMRNFPWMERLAEKLLENDPETVSLLEVNPFPDRPPRYLRYVTYEVRFADPVIRRERRVWWLRSVRGLYGPVFVRGRERASREEVGN